MIWQERKRTVVVGTCAYVLTVFLALVAPLCCNGQTNAEKQAAPLGKWEGFRGLKWGTAIADAPGMVLVQDAGDTKCYFRRDDKLAIGDAELKAVLYEFYKEQFYSVFVASEGFSNWKALERILSARYGEGRQNNTPGGLGRRLWQGSTLSGKDDVELRFTYTEFAVEMDMEFVMVYLPLEREQQAEKAKNEAKRAKEAGADF